MSKELKKMVDRIRMRGNQAQGRLGEIVYANDQSSRGNPLTRTGKGHDFRDKKGRYHEVKTGKSRVSRLQRKKKKSYGGRYIIKRY